MTIEEARVITQEWSRKMVAKWDKTGLLDNIKNDIDKSSMSVLLESKPKQIIGEQTEEEKRLHKALHMIMNYKHDEKTNRPT